MNQPDHIEEHLLLKYLLADLEDQDRQQVDEWLKKSEANRKQLDRLEVLWLETGKLDPPPVAVDTMAAWKRVSTRIDVAGEQRTGRIIPMPTIRWAAGIAAMLLIAMGAWWLAETVKPKEQMQVLASVEEVVKDTLPDGSMVTLNAHSSLSFPGSFAAEKREVNLAGEAFFDVTHKPGNPFIVLAGRAGIQVLGTSFNVRAYPDQAIEVTVITGKVLLFSVDTKTGDSASVILSKGMKGMISPGNHRPELDDRDLPDDLFWLNQTLRFRQTPLSEVIHVLESRYHVPVRFSPETLGSCRLTANFSGEPIDLILRVIAETFTLTLEYENGTYLITGHGCIDENR